MVKQVVIDHIEVSDYLIEVHYWVTRRKEKEAVFFKTSEFECWLCTQRQVTLDHYWVHWDPSQRDSYGFKIIWGDIENFFLHKMQILVPNHDYDFILPSKKPMKRVSGGSNSNKGSKTA